MENHQHINADSGNTEYYTPPSIIEAARAVLLNIDLDPASSARANEIVCADQFFTDGALDKRWFGRVWMNHPFSRADNAKWVTKLIDHYKAGDVTAALCITFASTSEKWFAPLMRYEQCYLRPRTNYLLPDGTIKRGVTKGSVVTYIGPPFRGFDRAFAPLGSVMRPYN